ncbi:MAG: peptide deformylase, partial [Clostridia bacterium]
MAIYSIEKAGESTVLRQKAKPVGEVNDTIRTLLDDMAETMYASEGVGLAAPQVGISRRIIVVDVGEGLIELVNPVLLKG